MAPKPKKAAAKRVAEVQEPPHNATWERTVVSGLWSRPVTDLPDADTWPSWGALRERVLSACREIRVPGDPSVRDAFVAELVKLAPPLLRALDLSGCRHLRTVSLSPATSCVALEAVGLRACPALTSVLIQSASLRQLDLTDCGAVTKVLLQCPRLSSLAITGCGRLATVMIWSAELQTLDLAGSTGSLAKLELSCPALAADLALPALPVRPVATPPPEHPPIATTLRGAARQAAAAAAEARERGWKADLPSCGIPQRSLA